MFFSSHVLSDAEALCSRVAIMARGRLITSGRLTEMLAFQVRGWEVVASRRRPRAARLAGLARDDERARSADDRYTFDLPLEPGPDRFIADLAAAGASLVSVNPLRDTLEDFFVRQVTAPDVQARDRGLGVPTAGGVR